MALLPESSLAGRDLSKILEKFGQKFLGEDAELTSFEAKKEGVSFNYKLNFGDESFILKVDNPTVGGRAILKDVIRDHREGSEKFNLIARFVNDKVDRGMSAPRFVGVGGGDAEFCITASKDDEAIPSEFRGNVISMQSFLAVTKPDESISSSEAYSLGHGLGILHRPSPLSKEFIAPAESPFIVFNRKQREKLEEKFGATPEERISSCEASAKEINSYMESISTSEDPLNKKLHAAMSEFFPGGKCSAEIFTAIVEKACIVAPSVDLSETRQISHNDLHPGNMLRDGSSVTLIDFDELAQSTIVEDLVMQFEAVLNIFRHGDKPMDAMDRHVTAKQEMLESFLTGYLAHNPYLSRSDLAAATDLTNTIFARFAGEVLVEILGVASREVDPSEEEIAALTNLISNRSLIAVILLDPENAAKERDLLTASYDKVFGEISKGRVVEALVDRPFTAKEKRLEYLDLARSRKQPGDWVSRVTSIADDERGSR